MSKRWRLTAGLAIGLGSLVAAPAHAAIFASYNAAQNDRFGNGITPNPTFLLGGHDLSAIAIDSTFSQRGTVLITREHVIGAWHFLPATISFVGTDGQQREYDVAQWTRLSTGLDDSDVAIGRLTTEVLATDNINPLPIAIGPDSAFIGHELYAFGQNNQAGRNIIDEIVTVDTGTNNPTVTTGYDFDSYQNGGTGGVGDDEIGLEGGDSGHASLILHAGQLGVLGTHFAIDASTIHPPLTELYSSYSSFARDYLAQIEAIAVLDGQTVSTMTVPEPTALAMLAAGGLLLMRRSRSAMAA